MRLRTRYLKPARPDGNVIVTARSGSIVTVLLQVFRTEI